MNALFSARLNHHPWHITPTAAQELRVLSETQLTLDDFITPRQPMRVSNGLALVNVCGVLAGGMPGIWEKMGNTDYRTLTRELRAAANDPAVLSVVLYVRSPGGNCAGCTEIYDLVAALAERKPVIAYTDGMMCSAAYYISSAATFIYASKTAAVGSIGCIYTLYDASEALKAMGVRVFQIASGDLKGGGTEAGWSAAQIADIERVIADYFEAFSSDVRKKRDISDDAMRGQWFKADKAPAGLVDFIGLPSAAASDALALAGGDGTLMAPDVCAQLFTLGGPEAAGIEMANKNHGNHGRFARGRKSVSTLHNLHPNLNDEQRAVIAHTQAAIDKVHGVPSDAPFSAAGILSNPQMQGAKARYMKGSLTGDIEMKPGVTNEADLLEEVGHHLDHQMGGQDFASKGSDLKGIHDAIEKSPPVKDLNRMAKSAVGRSDRTSANLREAAKPEEKFARAYTQYIATKSGDEKIMGQVKKDRSNPYFGKQKYWSDEDFSPIVRAFDSHLEKHQWK